MIDKIIDILQIILPISLLIKTIVMPHINKHITVKGLEQLASESDTKKYMHKKQGITNELHTITFFLYGLLIVWFNWPKLLRLIEHYVNDLGNIGNYIGAIIEIGFLIVLQLHMYKYALAQRMNVGESISKISAYKRNHEELYRNIYIFLIIEVFLQASIVGLIPFFQIDRFIYVDGAVVVCGVLAFIHALRMQAIVHSYSHQHLYLRSWTTFIFATIFQNISNAILNLFDGFLNMPFDSMSVVAWLLLRTIWICTSLIQLFCLLMNAVQHQSMEEWYND